MSFYEDMCIQTSNRQISNKCPSGWTGDKGIGTSAATLAPAFKKRTIQRGRKPTQSMTANIQAKGRVGAKARKNELAYSQEEGPKTTRADLSPHESFTPTTQEPFPNITWRAASWLKTGRHLPKAR